MSTQDNLSDSISQTIENLKSKNIPSLLLSNKEKNGLFFYKHLTSKEVIFLEDGFPMPRE